MSDNTSPSLFDISGFTFGLLGLAGTVQLFCLIAFYFFPKRRLHGLEISYAEAYFLYHCGVQEGILASDIKRIEEKLQWTRAEINEVHSAVFCLGGFWGQVFAIFGRLSQKFHDLNVAAKELCVDIASSSQKGRRVLEASGQCYKPCILPMMNSASIPLYPAMIQSTLGEEHTQRSHSESDFRQHCDFTPHQAWSAQASISHLASASAEPKPIHRDSMCSVSTSATVVDIDPMNRADATTIVQPGRPVRPCESRQPEPHEVLFLDVSKTVLTQEETASLATTIEDRYKDIQYLMELLLSNLHHLSELRPQPEERDISDEPSKFESCLSKLQHCWTRSPKPHILPL
ncbi:hypothetical protein QCA50_004817 [Cerrena zonata]|uniref:Uncharacterized protein n=1 Tax=Cerrena zonata TaxID=2478898 RepID=A0AAW0GD12_9APHY